MKEASLTMVGPLLVNAVFAVIICIYPKFVTDYLLSFFVHAL